MQNSRSRMITVRVPLSLIRQLDEDAERTGKTKTDIIVDALRRSYDDKDTKMLQEGGAQG